MRYGVQARKLRRDGKNANDYMYYDGSSLTPSLPPPHTHTLPVL